MRALLCIAIVFATQPGCRTIDRQAESLFVRGQDGPALVALQSRFERSLDDYALDASGLASVALATGDYRTARTALEAANRVFLGVEDDLPPGVAERLRTGSRRLYRGSPHDIVWNDLYRALLALRDGRLGEAHANLQEALGADGENPEARTHSDLPALYTLATVIALRLGKQEQAEQWRAAAARAGGEGRTLDLGWLGRVDTIVWVDSGMGPEMLEGSRNRRPPRYRPREDRVANVRVALGEDPPSDAIMAIDVMQQATQQRLIRIDGSTRDIEDTSEGGLLALINSSIVLLSVVSQPVGDVRHWHLLPARGHLWLGVSGDGPREIRLEALDAAGEVIPELEQRWPETPFEGERLHVFYLRTSPHRSR